MFSLLSEGKRKSHPKVKPKKRRNSLLFPFTLLLHLFMFVCHGITSHSTRMTGPLFLLFVCLFDDEASICIVFLCMVLLKCGSSFPWIFLDGWQWCR
ncbi:MAG: hypothetical protein J3R72DRAFT_442861 [Linnemannia gamsii]|nr:MAG: hypothetical protein J3R72DRAFT_442861 [Linnemannia gamsii]